MPVTQAAEACPVQRLHRLDILRRMVNRLLIRNDGWRVLREVERYCKLVLSHAWYLLRVVIESLAHKFVSLFSGRCGSIMPCVRRGGQCRVVVQGCNLVAPIFPH